MHPEKAKTIPNDLPEAEVGERRARLRAGRSFVMRGAASSWPALPVLMAGAKRFVLAPPGTVDRLDAVSAKYDRWACLADIGSRELMKERPGRQAPLFQAELNPGDALFIPHGWWHKVVNLQPSLFLSGFFGSLTRMLSLGLATAVHHCLHGLQPAAQRHCTCHAT